MSEKLTASQPDGVVFVVDNRRRDEVIKTVLLALLIIVFPPAAIAVHANECNIHVIVSLFLMFFFLIPAYLHAIWYCFIRKPAEHVIA